MKKLKQLTLGILSMGLLIAGLLACNNDELNNSSLKNIDETTNLKNREDGNIEIAEIRDGSLFFLIDLNILKTELLSTEVFAEITNIELTENYLTVIGKDVDDFSLVAYETTLNKIDSKIYFPSLADPITTFAEHSCKGNNCSECDFTRFSDGKIKGCECKSFEWGGGKCDHTKTSTDPVKKNKLWDYYSTALIISAN